MSAETLARLSSCCQPPGALPQIERLLPRAHWPRRDVKAWVTDNVQARTIRPLMNAHVMPDSTVFTDEAKQYGLVRKAGYQHRRVNHSALVYVDGDVHTNTIEGFWSLLKNGIRGVYHAVGKDYLQTYVNEYAFRYNHRRDDAPMFGTIAQRVRAVRSGRYGEYAPVGP